MKKILIIGTFAIALLMVSTATAVPTTNSETVINAIEKAENIKSTTTNTLAKGIIFDIIRAILDFIKGILSKIRNILNIIVQIMQLIDLIIDFIKGLISG